MKYVFEMKVIKYYRLLKLWRGERTCESKSACSSSVLIARPTCNEHPVELRPNGKDLYYHLCGQNEILV